MNVNQIVQLVLPLSLFFVFLSILMPLATEFSGISRLVFLIGMMMVFFGIVGNLIK